MSVEMNLEGHKKIALQFSGGRDSLAMLLYLRPIWDKVTVYYTNSGDAYPETLALVAAVKDVVPNFVEIQGKVQETREQFGWSSDVMPADANFKFGPGMVPGHMPLIDRYSCCYRSILDPMHTKMKEDGVTCLLRGQRQADNIKSDVQDGEWIDGFQIFYPINGWSTQEVDDYIEACGVDLPAYYAYGLTSAPDCMHCTAWLEHKATKYLSKKHPDVALEVNRRLQQIKVVVQPFLQNLDAAIEDSTCTLH